MLKGWAFKADPELARLTRQDYNELHTKCTLALYWVKAHDKLDGNEQADALAKVGMARNTDTPPMSVRINYSGVNTLVINSIVNTLKAKGYNVIP